MFSETINEYRDEGLLFELVNPLNKIEKKHSQFFKNYYLSNYLSFSFN